MGKKKRPAKGSIRKLQPEWVSRVDIETADFVYSLLDQKPVCPPPLFPGSLHDGSTIRLQSDSHGAVGTVAFHVKCRST
jgi:hypothetical protein